MSEKISSLSMLKMEKNFRALEKGYPRQPYRLALTFLLKRLKQEVNELEKELENYKYKKAKAECADVSNITDYIFEKISKVKTHEL